MAVLIEELDVVAQPPAAAQREAASSQRPPEAPPPELAREIERVIRRRAQRTARLEAD